MSTSSIHPRIFSRPAHVDKCNFKHSWLVNANHLVIYLVLIGDDKGDEITQTEPDVQGGKYCRLISGKISIPNLMSNIQ